MRLLVQGARGYRQVNINDAAAAQTVSPQVVPAADHGRRQTEIVGNGLHRVSAAHFVTGSVAGVGGAVFGGRMFARRDRDYELAVRLQFVAGCKMVFFFDRRGLVR